MFPGELKYLLGYAACSVALIVCAAITIGHLSSQAEKQRQAFMLQCLKYEPEYKCVAQWRTHSVSIVIR